jgi:hypothetical protein
MSASSLTSNTSDSSSSFKELCVVCQAQPYDLICTCGDKFDFTCIHTHVEQIGLEFQFIQNEVGERLLLIEQVVEDMNCTDAKAIVENWVGACLLFVFFIGKNICLIETKAYARY